jgi:hypothetical protein
MTTSEYLKEEGFSYYGNWPGIWPTISFTAFVSVIYFLIPECGARKEIVRAMAGNCATITGIMLAIGVTAITFQLGTLTVSDLQNFVGSEEAMKNFEVVRGSARWTIQVMIASFIIGILVSILVKLPIIENSYPLPLLLISSFTIAWAISHAGFAIRAAFDFAEIKVVIARILEEDRPNKSKDENKTTKG